MSKELWYKRSALSTLIILLIAVALGVADDSDPILSFYCKRAYDTFRSRDPLEGGISYSYTARTYFKTLGDRGKTVGIDSSLTKYYVSFGQADSSQVIMAPKRKYDELDVDYPNVFAGEYNFYFYPNDTGGIPLAIGFDPFAAEDDYPAGLAIIDRDRYFLRWLYLFYPNKEGYKRYSRAFRFVEHEGYIFPDSVWEMRARRGIFSTDFVRIETSISDITIYR